MGDRGQVHIKDQKVWLYTHWNATELVEAVRAALAKKWRWDDSEYLARIIFDEMTSEQHGAETGYGISGLGLHGDEWRVVEVDCTLQRVRVIDHGVEVLNESFEDFIKGGESDEND